MNHILAVCDSETKYACQLADYLNHQKGFPFQVQLFTSTDTLREFTRKQPLALALISEEDYREELKELLIEDTSWHLVRLV